MKKPRILIIGHARHGKDTVAEIIQDVLGLTYKGSSQAASEIFLYNALKDKYGYSTPEECFEDRVNHRAEWHDLICEYNKEDPTRLARAIMEVADMYVGMRSKREIDSCVNQRVFDYVIGVFDPRKPLEPKDSFNIELGEHCDFIIFNDGDLNRLHENVLQTMNKILIHYETVTKR